MNTSSDRCLFPNLNANTTEICKHKRTHINATLWCDDVSGFRVISLRHQALYRLAERDEYQMRLVAVMIRQSGWATQAEIGKAFGHSVATQRRWETEYIKTGYIGEHAKGKSGRPPIVNTSQLSFVKAWFAQGVSIRDMALRMDVSDSTIRRILAIAGLKPTKSPSPQLSLPLEKQVAPDVVPQTAPEVSVVEPEAIVVPVCADTPPEVQPETVAAVVAEASQEPIVVDSSGAPTETPVAVSGPAFTADIDPSNRTADRALARSGALDDAAPLFADHEQLPRAGVLIAIPELEAHGGLDVFKSLYGSIGPAFYGLRTTILTLVLMALLRIKRIENVKEYSPIALGQLLGLDRVAEVKTLRRKLTELAERGIGTTLMMELAKLRVDQDNDRIAFLYLDGHVREYSGQEPLSKAKKAQRAVATCAATDTWVNDADGSPLLLVTSELNASLTQMLEPIVRDALKLLPDGRQLTVVFDRGGWSPKLFAKLQALGVHIITYRKGKTKPIPKSWFTEHVYVEDGQEKSYWLYDQPRVRVGRLRPAKSKSIAGKPKYHWMRQITLMREDGRQIVVVTSRTDLPAIDVLRYLFLRWRQENFFKYMEIEFALDALVEYGADDVSEEATRPNPERKQLEKKRAKVQKEVERLRAELGAAAAANEEKTQPTMSGFKNDQAQLLKELHEAEQRLETLTEQIKQLPVRVSASGLKTLKAERKLIVDAIKIIAYQCETALLARLSQIYHRSADEGRTLLHAAFQSTANVEVSDTELVITIEAQSSPHRTVALADLCHDLNKNPVHYPGSNLRLRLAVADQKPRTP